MNEPYFYINKSIKLIEEKVGCGDSNEWTSSYFEILSEQMYQSTGIMVSVLTLKRLFGRVPTNKEKYNPQISTKNALAKFLGYKNWAEFIQVHAVPKFVPVLAEPLPVYEPMLDAVREEFEPTPATSSSPADRKKIGTATVAFVICTVIAVVLVLVNKTGHAVKLEGRSLVGQVPLYSAFYYDVTASKYENFTIDGDVTREPLAKDKHYQTLAFNVPNYYRVKLLAEGKEVAALHVHALSAGWDAVYQTGAQTFHLLPKGAFEQHGGRLYISPAAVAKHGFDTSAEHWIAYKNIRDFNASGDDFVLETRIRNNSGEGGIPCFDALIEVIGEHTKSNLVFVKPGSTKYVKVNFGEVALNGVFHDLSKFGRDLQEWRKVTIQVRRKKVKIYFEGELIKQLSYENAIGAIKGLSLVFKGTGAVDYVRLYNGNNQLTYRDEFGN